MQHKDKDFCLAHVTERDWKLISIKNNDGKFQYFVIVPSMAFKRLVLEKEYLRVVEKYPDHFGTNNDWDIVTALKKKCRASLSRRIYSRKIFGVFKRGNNGICLRSYF